jgi:hypothetical protein
VGLVGGLYCPGIVSNVASDSVVLNIRTLLSHRQLMNMKFAF